MGVLKFTLLSLMLLTVVNGFPDYQNLIPNGFRVFDVFGPWPGVGHINRRGGGQLNPFGNDFKNNNFRWTRRLCLRDSDGDGLSNGRELGDPNCVWIVGQPSPPGPVTHPGFRD
ncbi:temptin [Biomphalaria glabrata]|uniref:Temptin-like n=1 Tax=Biomphalaria glabrata TaxID=6526 RepID=A0A9U8EGS0_BIOGL|nr:temptin-like [Biomphalaria glabrata]